jgi:hypothetical protein
MRNIPIIRLPTRPRIEPLTIGIRQPDGETRIELDGEDSGTSDSTSSCGTCGKQFGTQVDYCPFCGKVQSQVEPPKPAAQSRPVGLETGYPSGSPAIPAGARVPENEENAQAVAAPPPDTANSAIPGIKGGTTIGPIPPAHPVARSEEPSGLQPRLTRTTLVATAIGVVMTLLIVGVLSNLSSPRPTGTVTVTAILPNGTTETSGTVSADGRSVGVPGIAIALPAGTAVIGYSAAGWTADEQRTIIATNANSTVRLRLRPMPAHVSVITSPSGADLRIDGLPYGRTPIDVTLADGRHELAVSLNGYLPKSSTLFIGRGEERRIDLDLAAVNPPPQNIPPPDYSTPAAPPTQVPTADSPPEPDPSQTTTAYLCGKSISYRGGVSYGQQILVGVWSGNWSSRVCGGLVVERIGSDGRADIVYVYVASLKPGGFRAVAEVAGPVINFVDPDGGRFTFMLEGGNLTARFVSAKGSELSAVFTRQ